MSKTMYTTSPSYLTCELHKLIVRIQNTTLLPMYAREPTIISKDWVSHVPEQ